MNSPDIDSIRRHIVEQLLHQPDISIEPDEDLLLSGILDSISVMRLVAWLEKQCAIAIPAKDIVMEHFGSLNQIMAYLQKRADEA